MNLSAGTLVLSGGTLNLGGFTSTFGSLTVTANSILDFGTSGSSILNLTSLMVNSGVTLTIANWTDAVDYFYSLTNPGAPISAASSIHRLPPCRHQVAALRQSDHARSGALHLRRSAAVARALSAAVWRQRRSKKRRLKKEDPQWAILLLFHLPS